MAHQEYSSDQKVTEQNFHTSPYGDIGGLLCITPDFGARRRPLLDGGLGQQLGQVVASVTPRTWH